MEELSNEMPQVLENVVKIMKDKIIDLNIDDIPAIDSLEVFFSSKIMAYTNAGYINVLVDEGWDELRSALEERGYVVPRIMRDGKRDGNDIALWTSGNITYHSRDHSKELNVSYRLRVDSLPSSDRSCPKCGANGEWRSLALSCSKCGNIW
jgi:ribosomal protein S27AE